MVKTVYPIKGYIEGLLAKPASGQYRIQPSKVVFILTKILCGVYKPSYHCDVKSSENWVLPGRWDSSNNWPEPSIQNKYCKGYHLSLSMPGVQQSKQREQLRIDFCSNINEHQHHEAWERRNKKPMGRIKSSIWSGISCGFAFHNLYW